MMASAGSLPIFPWLMAFRNRSAMKILNIESLPHRQALRVILFD
jgi:hypothetical protein